MKRAKKTSAICKEKPLKYRFISSLLMLYVLLTIPSGLACKTADNELPQAPTENEEAKPILEATPLEPGTNSWMIATSETVKFTVTAPEADRVELLHRPAGDSEDYFILKKLAEADQLNHGVFATEIKLPPDFSGAVWAEATYADGEIKESAPINLVSQAIDMAEPSRSSITNPAETEDGISTPDADSARADHYTHGKIEQTTFEEGQPDLAITVNVPAFRLTLWQNGKVVKTYDLGVGRKNFPIVIDRRWVNEIIFNPDWIPPDSEWVHKSKGIEPYERIEADDPRNPLGSLKIPLGDAYLIHQAAKTTDIGNLVSHGCLRMLKDDLFDLAEKIIAARNLPLAKGEIEKLKSHKQRQVVKLDQPLSVDINYDPQVIEEGVLHIYPDVYERQTDGIQALRRELQQAGLAISQLGDQTLKNLLAQANAKTEFSVSLSAIQAGKGLAAGKRHPLTEASPAPKTTDRRKRKPR